MRSSFPLLALLAAALLPAGCKIVDEYNLKDIDTTVNVLKGLQIPVGSLQEIHLQDFISFKEGGSISVDPDGNYNFALSLDPISYDWTVPAVSIPAHSMEDRKTFNDHVVLPAGTWSLPSMEVPGSFSYAFEWTWDGLPKEVTAIRGYHIQPAKVTISMTVEGLPFSEITVLKQSSDGMESILTLPKWLHILSCETSGFQLTDGNVLKLTRDCLVPAGKPIVIECMVDGAEGLTEADCTITKGSATVRGGVELLGTLFVSEQKLTVPASAPLTCSFLNKVGFGGAALQDATVKIAADLAFSETATYSVDAFSLTDGTLDLRFSDLSLDLSVENTLPVGLHVSAGLTTLLPGGQDGHAYRFEESFPGDRKVRLRFNETGTGKDPDVTYRRMEQLGSILSPAPESVRLTLDRIGAEDDWGTYRFGQKYTLSCQIGIQAPFAFEKGTELTVTQEVNNIEITRDESFSIEHATLALSVVNTIPLAMTLEAVFLDKEGKELKDMTISSAAIAAGSLNQPATTPVEMGISSRSLAEIASLRLLFRAHVDEATAGIPLNSRQGLKINDIVLTLDEGVTTSSLQLN